MDSADLLSRHATLWHEAINHPFLSGARDGTLVRSAFQAWLVQDYHFVDRLIRAQARLLAVAPRSDQAVLAGGLVGLVEELDWFEAHMSALGLTVDVPLAPVNRAYTDFLQTVVRGPYAAGITAIWAVEQAYLDAWTGAQPAEPPYREFVDHWTTPGFREYVAGLAAAANRALEAASPAGRAPAEDALIWTARYERDFWGMTFTAAGSHSP